MAPATIGHTPIYYGLDTNYDAKLVDPLLGSTTQSLDRVDLQPTISAPIGSLPFLSIKASAYWRFTHWSQSLNAAGTQVPDPISRALFDTRVDLVGPTVSRIFDTPTSGYAERFKNVIEPNLSIDHLTPINNFNSIVKLDGVDAIIGGATEFDYGITTRILAKRRIGTAAPVANEIFSFSVNQTYSTNQLSAAYDAQYQTTIGTGLPSNFSPISFVATVTPTSSASGSMTINYNKQYGIIQSISAGGAARSSFAVINASWSKTLDVSTLANVATPATATTPAMLGPVTLSHALNVSSTFKAPDNRTGGNWSWNYDFVNHYMIQQTFTGYLSTQCCGVAAEFQTVAIPTGFPGAFTQDRRFTLSFTLAGIGAFANPLGAFGIGNR